MAESNTGGPPPQRHCCCRGTHLLGRRSRPPSRCLQRRSRCRCCPENLVRLVAPSAANDLAQRNQSRRAGESADQAGDGNATRIGARAHRHQKPTKKNGAGRTDGRIEQQRSQVHSLDRRPTSAPTATPIAIQIARLTSTFDIKALRQAEAGGSRIPYGRCLPRADLTSSQKWTLRAPADWSRAASERALDSEARRKQRSSNRRGRGAAATCVSPCRQERRSGGPKSHGCEPGICEQLPQ